MKEVFKEIYEMIYIYIGSCCLFIFSLYGHKTLFNLTLLIGILIIIIRVRFNMKETRKYKELNKGNISIK